MPKKILLSGYFGFDNLGDEAILYSMINSIKNIKDVDIVVLSKNPKKTSTEFGVRSVNRMNVFSIVNSIFNCDIFVSGSGSLLQDITSKRSILYYLGLIYLAKRVFNKKTMIFAQGIGPVNFIENQKRVASIFNKLDVITIRDKDSKDELINMGVKKPIELTADPVFLLDKPDSSKGKTYLNNIGIDTNLKTVCISLRTWKEHKETTIKEIKKVVEYLQNQHINSVFLPLHTPRDLELSTEIYNSFENKKYIYIIKDKVDRDDVLSILANTDIMLSMRLHGLIFGAVSGACPIAISYDPKVDSLMKELGEKSLFDIKTIKSTQIITCITETLKSIEKKKLELKNRHEIMKKRALKNIELLENLLLKT